ncbi:MAG TPA: beta-propeller fold lactonase family protein [Candidatus Sulfotelmatobacter sp.]|nr:beta-propeller fold lactonase family protein [Candidatus Sulfotelmatobacter sp.]
MSKRLGLLGVGALLSIAVLLACGSKYNSSSSGLLLVGSRGSGLIETFSFTLNNGHVSAIANPPADTANKSCVLGGAPTSIVIDPAGAYAYAIIDRSPCGGQGAFIGAFKINSDGTIGQTGTPVDDSGGVSLAMDSAGKFLFVAAGNGVHVYSIGSGAGLSLVAGTYTAQPTALSPHFVALAPSPTVFPAIGVNGTQNSVCSVPGNNPPSSEYLYAVDSQNYAVWQFAVDTATGALGNPPGTTFVPMFSTDQVPAGIAVDPCNRFVYVSDSYTNKVSAYSICTSVQVSGPCPAADGRLVAVAGSPFSLAGNANGPGPIAVDPYGNNVYVVGTLSNTVSGFKISAITGALTAMNPAVVATGPEPRSIAIRGDDNWMFVANHSGPSVSQYSIVPATGVLTVAAPIPTDNYPWSVAVK